MQDLRDVSDEIVHCIEICVDKFASVGIWFVIVFFYVLSSPVWLPVFIWRRVF